MQRILIKGALVINRGKSQYMDVLTENDKIVKIDPQINIQGKYQEINGDGLWLIPGIIDDQVHFREPGFTHKADIASESKAAIAGGVTSFMEMPNTNPATLTQTLLQEKYDVAAKHSYANYSFFMGASNDNYDEVMRTNSSNVCGIKIFMGSSTGNMLVDNHATLNHLFANVPMLIATHCEDESTIRQNLAEYKSKYNDQLTAEMHPWVRSAEGCFHRFIGGGYGFPTPEAEVGARRYGVLFGAPGEVSYSGKALAALERLRAEHPQEQIMFWKHAVDDGPRLSLSWASARAGPGRARATAPRSPRSVR